MFNRTVLVTQPSRTEYVTREVHEHRAPTDKSVELLRDFMKSAEAEIERSVHLSSNDFSCVVHQTKDFRSDETIFKAIFDLNGKRMTAEAQTWNDRSKTPVESVSEAAFKLRDEIAKTIANECLQHVKF